MEKITPEEAEALYEQWQRDIAVMMSDVEEQMLVQRQNRRSLEKAALSLAIHRERDHADKKAKMLDWLVRQFKMAGNPQMSNLHHWRLSIDRLKPAHSPLAAVEAAYDREKEGGA